jgi:hypothetical protein
MIGPIRRCWRTLVLAALLLASGSAFGTAQQPDRLLVDGKEERLNTNPLEPWRAAHPDAVEMPMLSTANWRGYVATWEVAGGKLWLRRVEGRQPTGKMIRREYETSGGERRIHEYPEQAPHDYLPQLFDGRTEVVAEWFTGTLIVPRGELVEYVHMGYASTYERYLVVWVRRGEVVRQLELDAAQFVELRKERFEKFKQTEEYRQALARLGHADDDVFNGEAFLFEFLSERYLSLELEDDAAP